LKNLLKSNNYKKNLFFRNIKSSEVKHSSNLQKKIKRDVVSSGERIRF